MTYRELIDACKALDETTMDTEVMGFESGRPIFWASRLEIDAEGLPTLEGTDDLGGS